MYSGSLYDVQQSIADRWLSWSTAYTNKTEFSQVHYHVCLELLIFIHFPNYILAFSKRKRISSAIWVRRGPLHSPAKSRCNSLNRGGEMEILIFFLNNGRRQQYWILKIIFNFVLRLNLGNISERWCYSVFLIFKYFFIVFYCLVTQVSALLFPCYCVLFVFLVFCVNCSSLSVNGKELLSFSIGAYTPLAYFNK